MPRSRRSSLENYSPWENSKNYFSSRGSFKDTQTPIKTVYYIDKKNAEVLMINMYYFRA